MFLSNFFGKNQPKSPKIKIRKANQFENVNVQEDSNLQKSKNQNLQEKDFKSKSKQITSPRNNKNITEKEKKRQEEKELPNSQYVKFDDLKHQLKERIASLLKDRLNDNDFSANQKYDKFIASLENELTLQQIISTYTQTVVSIVKKQQNNSAISLQNKFRTVNLNKKQRTKLKLILSDSEEKQLDLLKNKGIQTYVRKIQDECEKYKSQYIKLKQRNKLMEREILKISVEFKNKRQLYIAEITRLTEILHSSFLSVGKMFTNAVNPFSQEQNYRRKQQIQPYSLHIPDRQNNSHQKKKLVQNQNVLNQLNRRKIKSLSPKREIENYYQTNGTKIRDFIPEQFNKKFYLNQKPQKMMKKNDSHFQQNEGKSSYFENKRIQVGSEPEKRQRNLQIPKNTMGFLSNVVGENKINSQYTFS